MRVPLALLVLALLAGCSNWSLVKKSYCSHHAGEGDCSAIIGGQDGGSDAGPVTSTFDGGPPLDWLRIVGGPGDDEPRDLVLSPDGQQLALSGHFVDRVDLGGGSGFLAESSGSQGQFVLELQAADGGLSNGVAIRCGNPSTRTPVPLAFTDGGLIAGATCTASVLASFLSTTGTQLALDGGPTGGAQEPLLLKIDEGGGVTLRYLDTPESYEPEKQLVAVAPSAPGSFFIAANLPRGSGWIDAGYLSDGGAGPMVARLDSNDFTPLSAGLVDCPRNAVAQWETFRADPDGGTAWGVLRASANPDAGDVCSLVLHGNQTFGVGNYNPGLHRHLFAIDLEGQLAVNTRSLGEVLPDGGALALAPATARSFYYAGLMSGYVESIQYTEPTLAVGLMDLQSLDVPPTFAFRPGPNSEASINDLAVVPGFTPQIWMVGTVRGELRAADGGVVAASYDQTSDGFVMRLDPSTLAPVKTILFGRPGTSETGDKLVARPPYLYVVGTVTGGSGPYTLGGQTATASGKRDVIVFRLTPE